MMVHLSLTIFPGHIPWCDYNPCFEQYGGICMYQEMGRTYQCLCQPGYTYEEWDDRPEFKLCSGKLELYIL